VKPQVCLIVDNPLRDLDGLVLLGAQLARRGVDAWLVPMYEQGFDCWAIGADFVLANYVRPNNLDMLKRYLGAGIRVGILDTEGVGGKSADEFAKLVARSGGAAQMDLYCVWGESQRQALEHERLVAADRLRVTGCPRYDFCAEPWSAALPRPAAEPGYVLVNTNFPVVNPRFSSGPEGERRTMIQAGFSVEFADAYVRDAKAAHAGMIDLMKHLLQRFPGQRFVLRPHPFESGAAYGELQAWGNFELRQEGTSVEWLSQACALVHLNCSTAVEAAMLGKPALSPAWLDSPTLNVPVPHRLSLHGADVDALDALLLQVLDASAGERAASIATLRNEVIGASYHDIDGHAAERAADAIVDTLGSAQAPREADVAPASLRGRMIDGARRVLGRSMYSLLLRLARKPAPGRNAKRFSAAEVSAIVARLADCEPAMAGLRVDAMPGTTVRRSRLASGLSVRISATGS